MFRWVCDPSWQEITTCDMEREEGWNDCRWNRYDWLFLLLQPLYFYGWRSLCHNICWTTEST